MELETLHLSNLEICKYKLFLRRRFLPMFLATFLGNFNDNVVRSGLVVLISYSARHGISIPADPEILVTMCSALLVLPMVLFSSLAGPLADKVDKAFLVRCTKFAEIFIMLGVAYGFYSHNITLLMVLLFVSGAHTTFYVPIKFSILPQHLGQGELLAGNGFIASGSYLAILMGMIAGGMLVEEPGNLVSITVLIVAVLGWLSSLFIPKAPSAHPETVIRLNLWRGSCQIINHVRCDAILVRIILLLSWFIVVGGIYVGQFANYARGIIHADNEVYILFLTVFSVGIAAGSLLCDTLLKGQVSTRFTSFSAFGIAFFTLLMVISTPAPIGNSLISLGEFLRDIKHLPVLFSMLMVAVCGGIYVVPLYAALQERTNPRHRSQIIAASNLSDSIAMSIAAITSTLLLYKGLLGVQGLFVVVALVSIVVAVSSLGIYKRQLY